MWPPDYLGERFLDSILGEVVATLLVASFTTLLAYLSGIKIRELSYRGRPQRTFIFEGRRFLTLGVSPTALQIAAHLAIFIAAMFYSTMVMRADHWQLVGLAVVLVVLLLANVLREFYRVYWSQQDTLAEICSEFLHVLQKSVIERIEDEGVLTRASSVVRCNIMIYDSQTRLLRITHSAGMENDIDRSLALEPWKGVAGHCWQKRQAIYGDISELRKSANIHPDEWGFTVEDWRKVRGDLEWIWSFPLKEDTGKEPFGVLNVDSNIKIPRSLASNVGELVQDYAILLSTIGFLVQ